MTETLRVRRPERDVVGAGRLRLRGLTGGCAREGVQADRGHDQEEAAQDPRSALPGKQCPARHVLWSFLRGPGSPMVTHRTAGRARPRAGVECRGAHRALHHLRRRHAVPGDGPGRGARARAAGARGRVPGGADLLRADARQQRVPRRSAAAGAAVRGRDGAGRRRGRGRLAVVLVRRLGARAAAGASRARPATSGSRATPRRSAAGSSSSPSSSSAASASRTSAPSFPRRVTCHPTCHSQRVTRIGDAPLRLLAHVRGLELLELPEADGVLRLRRHLLDQERRRLAGDARGQVPQHPGDGRRGRAPPSTRRACCTSAAG